MYVKVREMIIPEKGFAELMTHCKGSAAAETDTAAASGIVITWGGKELSMVRTKTSEIRTERWSDGNERQFEQLFWGLMFWECKL